jgi:Uma2 family endonuclease
LRARIFSVLGALGRAPTAHELGELFPDPAGAAAVGELTFMALPATEEKNWVAAAALRLKLRRLLELNRDFQGRVQAMELAGEAVQDDLMAEWRHVGESIRVVREQIDQVLTKQKGF